MHVHTYIPVWLTATQKQTNLNTYSKLVYSGHCIDRSQLYNSIHIYRPPLYSSHLFTVDRFHCTSTHANVCTYRHTHLMMIPLSTEKLSVGRPEMFHSRILTGSPRVELRENSSERGIPFSEQNLHHSLIWSYRNKHECKYTRIYNLILLSEDTTSALIYTCMSIHSQQAESGVMCMYVHTYTLTCLKEEVKAPKYATSPADISTSPVRLL